jgi:hypothetical protein
MVLSKKIFQLGLLFIFMLGTSELIAQKRNTRNGKAATSKSINNNRAGSNNYRHDRVRNQPIRRSAHYRYPRHRRAVRVLPRHHVSIVYRGLPYFYHAGIYYTTYGNEYAVILPPRGFRIGILPVGHVRIVMGPTVYYYHSGIYYIATPNSVDNIEPAYEVVTPPVGTIVSDIHEDSQEVLLDGNIFYEYNDVLYKRIVNDTYEVIYNNN